MVDSERELGVLLGGLRDKKGGGSGIVFLCDLVARLKIWLYLSALGRGRR